MAIQVLVQAGHVAPREPGFEGGTGTVREQEFVLLVRRHLLRHLQRDDRFEGIAAPGDIPNGIKVDAAIFLHGDGSSNPEATGISFGYPDYEVNKKLADLIWDEFRKIPGHPPHHADNYTADLHGYYGFRLVDTPGPEVLVEHGFLTNPDEQKWMFDHVPELARAEYVALCRFFGFAPRFATRLYRIELWVGNKKVAASRYVRKPNLPKRFDKFSSRVAARVKYEVLRGHRPMFRRRRK